MEYVLQGSFSHPLQCKLGLLSLRMESNVSLKLELEMNDGNGADRNSAVDPERSDC